MAHRTANLKATSGSSHNHQSAIENRQFFKRVYAVVRTIPRGKVLTYGQIATLVRSPYMARQVGWAMHGCPKGLPWQRVVGAGGKILVNSLSVGDGALLQRRLLELEGVRFKGQRIDMEAHQFIPAKLQKPRKSRSVNRRLPSV
jgi:methylated-DNA-protein-cysteine methyltransferase-like protein